MIKYILYPGEINPLGGTQRVYIGPNTLCDLYGVSRDETVTYSQGHYWHKGAIYKPKPGTVLLRLTPRADNNYILPLGILLLESR